MGKCSEDDCKKTSLYYDSVNKKSYCLSHIPLNLRDSYVSKRHEHSVVNSLLKNLEISEPNKFSSYRISHDTVLGDTGVRPDLLIKGDDKYVVVEVDENQHSTVKNIIADEKREDKIKGFFKILEFPIDVVRIIPGETSSHGITKKDGIIHTKSGYNNTLNKLTQHVSKSLTRGHKPTGISTRVSYTGNLVSPEWKSIIDDPFSPELSDFKSNKALDRYLSSLASNSEDKENLKAPETLQSIIRNVNRISRGKGSSPKTKKTIKATSPRTVVVNYIRKMARDSDDYTGSQRFQTTTTGNNRYLVLGGKNNVSGIQIGYTDTNDPRRDYTTNSIENPKYMTDITERYLTNTGSSRQITSPIRLTVSRRNKQTSPKSLYPMTKTKNRKSSTRN